MFHICSPRSLQTAKRLLLCALLLTAGHCLLASVAKGTTITVTPGNSIQDAIDSAQPGDTIVLTAGGTYTLTDTLILKAKSGSSYITIQTSSPNMPPFGWRVTPDLASLMPKIVAAGVGTNVFTTEPGAHHYRFVGLNITMPAIAQPGELQGGLLVLGDASSGQISNMPHHFIVDRCYIHGDPGSNLQRGITLNSEYTDIIGSYISDVHHIDKDSQAIGGWTGKGKYRIINNFLSAAGENILFGGANAFVTLADIEIRRNFFFKPMNWKTDNISTPSGTRHWLVKNLLEFKNGRNVAIDGNLFVNNWVTSNQAGYAILFTPRGTWDDSGPLGFVQDVTFTNNVISNSVGGVNFLGYDDLCGDNENDGEDCLVLRLKRILVRNNLFTNINDGIGRFVQLNRGSEDVTITHNTVFHTGSVMLLNGDYHMSGGVPVVDYPNTRLTFTNNVMNHNSFGITSGDLGGIGATPLNAYARGAYDASTNPNGYVFRRNLISANCTVDDTEDCVDDIPPRLYPETCTASVTTPTTYTETSTFNYFPQGRIQPGAIPSPTPSIPDPPPCGGLLYPYTAPDAAGTAKFVNYTGGNYRLSPGTFYRNKGTDGRDVGANSDLFNPALRSSDFDGDRKTDVAVWRPSNGTFYVTSSVDGSTRALALGTSGDVPVPADYDGDGLTDYGVFRPSTNVWYLIKSQLCPVTGASCSGAVLSSYTFGSSGDIPVPGDYDGDNVVDIAVFRPSTGAWYALKSSDAGLISVSFGTNGDIPVVADYDGDGKTDYTVFRPSTGVWYILKSFDSAVSSISFGSNGDKPMAADFDGDDRVDIGTWRASTGYFYLLGSLSGFTATSWGTSGDQPVPGDYDRDNITDFAVWRPSTGNFYIKQSSVTSGDPTLTISWGTSGDVPVTAPRLP